MAHQGGILTLAFGRFPSFVSSHYFNFQVPDCL